MIWRISNVTMLLVLLSIGNTAYSQPVPSVPTDDLCQGPPSSWDNCVGIKTFPNGNIYRGEFRLGMRDGIGILDIIASGKSDDHNILSVERSSYIGQFKRDRLNGYGVWITKSGVGYSGIFVNNIPSASVHESRCLDPEIGLCISMHQYPNGNFYAGEFVNGRREGIGMMAINARGTSDNTSIRSKEPATYIGTFENDRLNGYGIIIGSSFSITGIFNDNILSQ